MIRKIVTYILILTMSTSGWAGAVVNPVSANKSSTAGKTCTAGIYTEMSEEEMIARISRYADTFGKVRSLIDRSQFDLGALLEKLDYDAEKIINFTKNDIYFEQYPGFLRGAQGTLMSRAGNALDQSVLLAGLLNDAGFEARIARGLLDKASASVLLKQMTAKRTNQRPVGDTEKMKAAMSSMLQELSGMSKEEADKQASVPFNKIDITESPIYSKAIAETDMLLTRLKTEGFFKETEKSDLALNEEAREYFWVQWREGPKMPWANVDVALSTKTAFRRPDVAKTFSKKIPNEFQHRFRVEVSLDRDFNGKSNHTILARTRDQATAKLLGTPISISLVPNGLLKREDYADLKKGLKRTTLWTPVIDKVPGKLAFDFQGNVVDSMAASAAGAALFQTVGNKFSTAIESTGDRENKGPIAQLTHLWIDQITTSPGGKETRYRTDLLSKSMISLDAGKLTPSLLELEMKGLLSSSHSLMLAVGRYPESYVLDKTLGRIVDMFRFLITQSDYVNIDWSKIDTALTGQFYFFSMADFGIDNYQGLSFRNGPSIVSFSNSILPSGGMRSLINIVASPKRSFTIDSSLPKSNPEKNVFSGVWESLVEGEVLNRGPGRYFSAASMLGDAAQSDENFIIITSDAKKLQHQFNITDFTKNWIEEDLAKGYSVILPTRQLEGDSSRSVWWRIKPETGETLAMMQGGYGQAATEYFVLVSAGISVLYGLYTLIECVSTVQQQTGTITTTGGLGCSICALFATATAFVGLLSLPAAPTAGVFLTLAPQYTLFVMGLLKDGCPNTLVRIVN